jgi:hypothetical protein
MIEAFERFGGVVTALRNGDTAAAVIEADKASDRIVAEQIEAEGDVATPNTVKARKSGILARRAFTDLVQALLGKDADPEQVGKTISILTNMVYESCFGVPAESMKKGLCCNNPRDTFSPNAIRAIEYAETALCAGFGKGRFKSMADLKSELARISPLLQMMANQMGDEPVVMENVNGPRVRTRPQGTFQGLLPAGASKVGFAAKLLTSEQG